jgi:hypothetical protein
MHDWIAAAGAAISQARSLSNTAHMKSPSRGVVLTLVAGFAVVAISIPVLAASPPPSAAPAGSAAPHASAKPEKSAKPDKGPETAISLKGTVQKTVDGDGRPTYTTTVDTKTWTLSAGPTWFWGDKNPLAAFVGKSVTVAGTTHSGEAEVDVETVDGKALREEGKPPWAGGPWVVGPIHPGWKDWMADGKPGNGHGRENAPGQLKKDSATP